MTHARRTKQDRVTDIIFNIILILVTFISLYPLWFVIIASISDPAAIADGKVLLLPKNIEFTAYTTLLENARIWEGYRNSLLYLFGGTFCMLAVTLPAAYALSRKKLKGRRVLNLLFVISMYFSGGLIPTYLLHKSLGWINTPWVMVIPAALNVYYLILARSSFESGIPEALYESAAIDGASDFRFFLQFAIPLSKATIAVLFLFSALSWWNEYLRFLIYIDNPNLQSLQVIIRDIMRTLSTSLSEHVSTDEMVAAQRQAELMKYSVVVIAALPFCVIYPAVQKYFNQGIMVGAIKG